MAGRSKKKFISLAVSQHLDKKAKVINNYFKYFSVSGMWLRSGLIISVYLRRTKAFHSPEVNNLNSKNAFRDLVCSLVPYYTASFQMALYDGWRKDGFPTLYGPLKTAVTADVLEAGFIYAIVILAFSLLLVLPGIRGRQVSQSSEFHVDGSLEQNKYIIKQIMFVSKSSSTSHPLITIPFWTFWLN